MFDTSRVAESKSNSSLQRLSTLDWQQLKMSGKRMFTFDKNCHLQSKVRRRRIGECLLRTILPFTNAVNTGMTSRLNSSIQSTDFTYSEGKGYLQCAALQWLCKVRNLLLVQSHSERLLPWRQRALDRMWNYWIPPRRRTELLVLTSEQSLSILRDPHLSIK